jgi:hypothetical protein
VREDPPTDRFSPIPVIVCPVADVALDGLHSNLAVTV